MQTNAARGGKARGLSGFYACAWLLFSVLAGVSWRVLSPTEGTRLIPCPFGGVGISGALTRAASSRGTPKADT
ncbi:MAG: hypothetical protein H0U54_13750 [Acidobacteria bacterium]|nr:hypothetical protein [Acidobacteriota bacterium]